MGSHQKIEYQYLLDQLIAGKLTDEEKNSLVENIQSSFNDQELDLLMKEHWAGLENEEFAVDEVQLLILKDQILSKILQAPKSSPRQLRHLPYEWLVRVAAILFIPLLLTSVYLFNQVYNPRESALVAMQQVVANPGSRVHFTLPDQTEVWLNSESKLEYPLNLTQLDSREVKLTGQGYFKVAHDARHPFRVITDKCTVQALGTSFDVSNYSEDQQISSTLEEGAVAILGTNGKEIARLYPGQKAVFDKVTNNMSVENVETKLITSWKDGKLIFRNASLPEVTSQLERWFNCKVHTDSALMKSGLSYTATIQDETLGEVLKMMEISTSVKTKIEKREVYIYYKN